MSSPENEPSSLPWFREELRNKMAALEQEIAGHRHTLDLLRQTESAYGRFVPHKILRLLNVESILDLRLGEQIEQHMTILFSDIRDFTRLSETLSPKQTFAFINSYLGEMEPIITKFGGIVDKYIGDAIMAIFPTSADAGLQGAIAMLDQLDRYNAGRERAGYPPVRIGIGLNAGIVMLGTVGGVQRMEGTVVSDAVNLASRLEDTTKIYKAPLLVSEMLIAALADPYRYRIRYLDRIRVKGKTQPQSVYEVYENDAEAVRSGKDATRSRFEQAVAYYHLKEAQRAIPLLEACVREVPEDYPAQLYLQRCRDYLATGQHVGTGEISATLEWREEFMVGVEQIDTEHKQLVEHMNRLSINIRKSDHSGIGEILDFLQGYVQFHFQHEEALMRAASYPMLEDHLNEHRNFGARFSRLKADIASGLHEPLYLGFQIQLFLFDWFANHTTRTDRHLGKFLRAREAESDSRKADGTN